MQLFLNYITNFEFEVIAVKTCFEFSNICISRKFFRRRVITQKEMDFFFLEDKSETTV